MYVFCIILYMMTETKLRSFNVENPNIYQRFKQIQLERGKTTTQRLNELIGQDVKEADPQFKELAAVRSKDAPDIITPNPFLLDQAHSIPEWEGYLTKLTGKQGNRLCMHLIALLGATKQFGSWVDHD